MKAVCVRTFEAWVVCTSNNTNRVSEDVCLKLEQNGALRHPAVDTNLLDGAGCVFEHRLENISRLEAHCFKHRTADMLSGAELCQADKDAVKGEWC